MSIIGKLLLAGALVFAISAAAFYAANAWGAIAPLAALVDAATAKE